MAALLGLMVFWAAPHLTSKPPAAPKRQTEIIVGLDLSKSNPLISDAKFAAKVAARVAPMVEALRLRDEVKIRTFGAYDPREQPLHIDQAITTDNLAEDSARVVQGIIAGVPILIQRGTLKAQSSTNVIGFLENMAEIVDCKKHDVIIVLASDGIEQSDEAQLSSGGTLPKPKSKLFAGCKSLQILGLGVGAKSPSLTDKLRTEWQGWADAAGFKDFQGLNDW